MAALGVYFVFTVSGAAALVYQVLWARWLGFVFGNTTTSVSIVLGSFMLGLALGSRLVGSRVERIRNPLAAYAWLELGIGAFALAFPFLSGLADRAFTALVSAGSPAMTSLGVRAALSFGLLAVPTTLMGATLPLLADFFRRSPRHGRAWRVGLLYAANTFGAALGSLSASFVLIELVGVRATTIVAACLNVAVALWAFAASRSATLPPAVDRAVEAPRDGARTWLALGLLAASGALALASEVLWTRALEILVGNSSYAFALLLVVYLVGIAAGSWAGSLVIARLRGPAWWLGATQAAMGLWTVVALVLFNYLSLWLRQYEFTPVPVTTLLTAYLRAGSILFPLAFLSGAVFPIATRILDPNAEDAAGARIARAYAWNTMGALAGAMGAGFLLAPHLDYFQSLYAVSALYGLTALAVVAAAAVITPDRAFRAAALGLAVLSLGLVARGATRAADRDWFKRRWESGGRDRRVLFHRPGIQGVTSVVGAGGELQLLVNGTGMTRKVTATKMMAHLPLLVHPDPLDTLVICFGMGTTYRSAITHGGRVTAVELVREVYEAFPHFYDDAARVLAYPRGKRVTNDGRNFLKLTRGRYDIITIDPPPPIDAAGVNNLYSKEFIELARDHLQEGGILAHWIPGPGSKCGVDDWGTFYTLLRTITEVFPEVLIVPSLPLDDSVGAHVLASMKPIYVSPDRIGRRMKKPAIARDMNEWDTVPPDYFSRLAAPGGRELAAAPLCTDDRPRLEFDLIRAWRQAVPKTYPMIWW